MKHIKITSVISIFLSLVISSCTYAENNIIQSSPKYCKHGLNKPAKGDFSIYVFCDDASGTQIGVILTRQGVGPVEENTAWSNVNRFWQEGLWMVDVKQFVWSDSGNYLYVATSEIYSDDSLYELDLRNRKAVKLLDGKKIKNELNIDKIVNNKIHVGQMSFNIKD